MELGRTKGGVARDLYLSPCQRDSHLELGSRASLHLRHLPCRPGRTDGETGANRHGIGYDGASPSRNPCTMTGSTGTPHRPLSAETRLCTTYQGLARGADISVWANGGAPQIDLDPCGVHYIPSPKVEEWRKEPGKESGRGELSFRGTLPTGPEICERQLAAWVGEQICAAPSRAQAAQSASGWAGSFPLKGIPGLYAAALFRYPEGRDRV